MRRFCLREGYFSLLRDGNEISQSENLSRVRKHYKKVKKSKQKHETAKNIKTETQETRAAMKDFILLTLLIFGQTYFVVAKLFSTGGGPTW